MHEYPPATEFLGPDPAVGSGLLRRTEHSHLETPTVVGRSHYQPRVRVRVLLRF